MFFKPFCLSIYLPTCHQQILSNAYHKKDAPRAVTCDDLHLRTSAQHWHISAFFVTGNSPEFPVITSENTLREFPLVIATVAKVSQPTLSLIRQAPRSVYFLFSDKIYYILSVRKSQVCTWFRT